MAHRPAPPQRFDEVYQLLSRAPAGVAPQPVGGGTARHRCLAGQRQPGRNGPVLRLARCGPWRQLCAAGRTKPHQAAACGCPWCWGHTFNFEQAAVAACSAGAAQRVDGMAQGLRVASEWASDPSAWPGLHAGGAVRTRPPGRCPAYSGCAGRCACGKARAHFRTCPQIRGRPTTASGARRR